MLFKKKLAKRSSYKYAGDIYKELMRHSDWSVESIIEFLNSIPDADVVERDNFTIENMTKVTLDIENKVSELKEKIKQHKSIVDIDDKTLFQYHKEVEQLANEISNELLRREP